MVNISHQLTSELTAKKVTKLMEQTSSATNPAATKKVNKIKFNASKREGRRDAEILAGLIAQYALQVTKSATTSVIDHLSLVLHLEPSQKINLSELLEIKKVGGAITATVLKTGADLNLRDLLAPGAQERIGSARLADALQKESVSVPLSAFRGLLAPWKNSPPFEKHVLLALAAHYAGKHAWFVTSNFNERKGQRVRQKQAAGQALGRTLPNETAELSKVGPTCLCLELTDCEKQRPHIHGLVITDCRDELAQFQVELAASDMPGTRCYKKRQSQALKVVPAHFSPGAVLYSFKRIGGILPEDSSTTFFSNDAVTMAKHHRDELVGALAVVLEDAHWLRGRPLRSETTEVEAFDVIHLPERPASSSVSPSHDALLELIQSIRLSMRKKRYPGKPKNAPITSPSLNQEPDAGSASEHDSEMPVDVQVEGRMPGATQVQDNVPLSQETESVDAAEDAMISGELDGTFELDPDFDLDAEIAALMVAACDDPGEPEILSSSHDEPELAVTD